MWPPLTSHCAARKPASLCCGATWRHGTKPRQITRWKQEAGIERHAGTPASREHASNRLAPPFRPSSRRSPKQKTSWPSCAARRQHTRPPPDRTQPLPRVPPRIATGIPAEALYNSTGRPCRRRRRAGGLSSKVGCRAGALADDRPQRVLRPRSPAHGTIFSPGGGPHAGWQSARQPLAADLRRQPQYRKHQYQQGPRARTSRVAGYESTASPPSPRWRTRSSRFAARPNASKCCARPMQPRQRRPRNLPPANIKPAGGSADRPRYSAATDAVEEEGQHRGRSIDRAHSTLQIPRRRVAISMSNTDLPRSCNPKGRIPKGEADLPHLLGGCAGRGLFHLESSHRVPPARRRRHHRAYPSALIF